MSGTTANDSIYAVGNVTVTRTLVQVGSVSYPINGIGSVQIAKQNRAGFFLAGGIMVVVGAAITNSGAGAGIILIALGAVIFVGGFLRKHILLFRTASGNQQALEARDLEYLENVKRAVETAVMMRG